MTKKGKSAEPDFGGFSILQGKFQTPENEDETLDDVVAGDDTIIDEDAERLAAGDKALLEQEERLKKSKKSKDDEIVDDDEDTSITDEDSAVSTDNNEEDEVSPFKVFAKQMYEKGTIDFDDTDEDFDDSETGIDKLVNKTVENRINKFVESLDEDYRKLLEFTQNGGRVKDFLDIYYGDKSWDSLDIEDNEDNQKLVVKESLKLSGESDEDIEDMITEWNDNGTLGKRAKSAKAKLVKYQETEQERIIREQEEKAAQLKAQREASFKAMKEDLMKKDSIMGFKLTPKLKEQLWEFATVPDKKTGKTAYEEAIKSKTDAQWLFALQAMQGFDRNKLETFTRTKAASEIRDLLITKGYKSTKTKISSGSDNNDFENDPFAGFKSK